MLARSGYINPSGMTQKIMDRKHYAAPFADIERNIITLVQLSFWEGVLPEMPLLTKSREEREQNEKLKIRKSEPLESKSRHRKASQITCSRLYFWLIV
jgi:hypothetical protein